MRVAAVLNERPDKLVNVLIGLNGFHLGAPSCLEGQVRGLWAHGMSLPWTPRKSPKTTVGD